MIVAPIETTAKFATAHDHSISGKALLLYPVLVLLVASLAPAASAQTHVDHSAHAVTDGQQSATTSANHDHQAAMPVDEHEHQPQMPAATHDHVAPTSDTPDHSTHTAANTMPAHNHDASESQQATGPNRDPHGYSNGYQLGVGAYALEGGHGLHMMDEMSFGGFRMNLLERAFRDGEDVMHFDSYGWYGNSYDKLVVKTLGEVSDGDLEVGEVEILWSHAFGSFWDSQLGVRLDTGDGPDRQWLAMGVQGIAPYWFNVEATAYLGQSGRTALNLEADYDLLITQKLMLQPRVELNIYGKDDVARGIGSGLSDSAAGLRLQYQINRQLLPYIGIEQVRLYGNTADFSRGHNDSSETRWLAGLRFWF